MDFLKAVNIIGRDLEEAMALLEQLSGVSGPELAEIELARSRVRSASELLKLLPGLTGPREVREAWEVREEKTKTTVRAPESEPVYEKIPEQAPEPAQKSVTAPAPRQEPLPEPQPVYETKPEPEPLHKPEPVPVTGQPGQTAGGQKSQKSQEPSKPILADRFSQSGTLGDTISPMRQDEAITTAMHSKPIADIGAAIGINDRFYFIRELFSGDALAYSDTIRRLNASASLGEAMRILDESTVMGTDPAAQSSFVDVVRRKFSLNV